MVTSHITIVLSGETEVTCEVSNEAIDDPIMDTVKIEVDSEVIIITERDIEIWDEASDEDAFEYGEQEENDDKLGHGVENVTAVATAEPDIPNYQTEDETKLYNQDKLVRTDESENVDADNLQTITQKHVPSKTQLMDKNIKNHEVKKLKKGSALTSSPTVNSSAVVTEYLLSVMITLSVITCGR